MSARLVALLLLVAGCAGPPTLPPGAQVSAAATGTPPTVAAVREALRDGLEQDPPAPLVERVHGLLASKGTATVEVPHDGHVHYYVLTWVAGHGTLVFFERTGDGVERLRAFPR